jgi:DNA primase
VVVVEGYIDALAMHQAGIVNTVALMGTAVSEHQIAALKRLAPTVVLMLDGDEAGAQATLRAGALAATAGLEVLVASLPSDSDPAALVQRHGADAAREVVAHAGAFARFRVQRQIECSDLSTAEAKDRLVGELREVFIDIPPSAVREDLIALVANRLGLGPALVRTLVPTRDVAVRGQPVVAEAHAQSPSGPPGHPAGAVGR